MICENFFYSKNHFCFLPGRLFSKYKRFFTLSFLLFQVFQNCLFSLQREQFLQDIDSERLFSNIQEVYQTNRVFWNEYLRHVVAEAKRTREPIKPSQLLDSFAKVLHYLLLIFRVNSSFVSVN